MDTTQSTAGEGDAPRARPRWALGLVYHPQQPSLTARWCWLETGTTPLGRGSELFGADALADGGVSREHAAVELDALAELTVADAGSRNGTFVNGRRITRARLEPGDVISLGSLMLVVDRRLAHDGDDADACAPHAAATAAAMRALAGDGPILLCGETGAGKDQLARELHRASGRDGDFVVVRCGAMPAESAAADLFGRAPGELGADDPGRAGLVETADRGTLYLDGIEDAPGSLQSALLGFLDTGEARRSGSRDPERIDVRVIASTRRSPRELPGADLRPAFVERLKRWTISVPPLRARPGDILPLARTFVSRYAGADLGLHRKLRLALQRHRFPGNVRELEALIEALVAEHDGDGPLLFTLETAERLAADEPMNSHNSRLSAGQAAMLAAASGAWFELDGKRTSLETRKALRLLVAALLDRRRDQPGAALSVDDLLAIGWPDEIVIPEAGRNRVFVALTTLRKMGLRDVILRQDDGYYLDPALRVQIENQ